MIAIPPGRCAYVITANEQIEQTKSNLAYAGISPENALVKQKKQVQLRTPWQINAFRYSLPLFQAAEKTVRY